MLPKAGFALDPTTESADKDLNVNAIPLGFHCSKFSAMLGNLSV